MIIGCAGGGSILGGLISPFMGEKIRGVRDYQFLAVEPASCPSLTRGKFAYDYCDTGMVTQLAKMCTLGSGFIPSASHSGGLRYHGMNPVLSQLYADGLMEARSVTQTEVFEAAQQFSKVEGILPAPESSHAIRAAIVVDIKCKETGEENGMNPVLSQLYADGLMEARSVTQTEVFEAAQQFAKFMQMGLWKRAL